MQGLWLIVPEKTGADDQETGRTSRQIPRKVCPGKLIPQDCAADKKRPCPFQQRGMPQLKELQHTRRQKNDGSNAQRFRSGENKKQNQYPEDFIEKTAQRIVDKKTTVAGVKFGGKAQWNDYGQNQNDPQPELPHREPVTGFTKTVRHDGANICKIGISRLFR